MTNILIDLNLLLDYYEEERRTRFPDSVKAFEYLKYKDFAFVSVSSIDNFEFLKDYYLKKEFPYLERRERRAKIHKAIEEFLSFFKTAPTPSYIEIDYDDIEDSQILASAKAVDALVLTRDEKMLTKYPDRTISPAKFLSQSLSAVTKIDFANLKKQYFRYFPELEEAMDGVLNRATYIMGDAVTELEKNLCDFTGATHAVTCSSGTDALLLAMLALDIGPGDEVITTPFTFIATAETIALLGAKPVFVDIDEETYNIDPNKIEAAITDKTKAIMPVSLYGQPSDMEEINAIAGKYNLKVIVDGAQSFGATYQGKAEVHWCDIYTTSFFPAKPLGCFGDGGAVLTNDDTLAEKMRMLRVHGQNKRYHHKYIGLGARMDTIQCAVVNVKLKYYAEDLKKRQEVAKKYTDQLITCHSSLITPVVINDRTSAFAQYSIRVQNRYDMQKKLSLSTDTQIPTAVHYPMPLHLQECFSYLGYGEGDFPIAEKISNEIISLPMNPYLTDEEINYVCKNILSST